jgi:hypothetical protein
MASELEGKNIYISGGHAGRHRRIGEVQVERGSPSGARAAEGRGARCSIINQSHMNI